MNLLRRIFPRGSLQLLRLLSLSGMVEIPRPFDGAQGMLQAKRRSVMPAQSLPPRKRGAGIQCGGMREHIKPGFPLSRERRKRESRLRVDVFRIPRLIAEGCSIVFLLQMGLAAGEAGEAAPNWRVEWEKTLQAEKN